MKIIIDNRSDLPTQFVVSEIAKNLNNHIQASEKFRNHSALITAGTSIENAKEYIIFINPIKIGLSFKIHNH